jgi:hypothetical protein
MPRSTSTPVWPLLLLVVFLGLFSSTVSAEVVINDQPISHRELQELSMQWNQSIPDGRYWYDATTGAWGYQGQGTAGFVAPGLTLGGPLSADASNGHTGVFINGRQLPDSDVIALMQMGIPVQQGRWWVDAFGNAGAEGGPPLFNLRVMAQQALRTRGGGDSIYNTWGSGDNKSSTWIGSDGSLSQSTTINGKTYDYYIGD